MFEACKSSGLVTGDGEVCSKDAYYVGIVLDIPDGKGDADATVTDGNGKVIDYIYLMVWAHGDSRSHNVPIPVLAPGGINVTLTVDKTAKWIVYYAEQYFSGHRHV